MTGGPVAFLEAELGRVEELARGVSVTRWMLFEVVSVDEVVDVAGGDGTDDHLVSCAWKSARRTMGRAANSASVVG